MQTLAHRVLLGAQALAVVHQQQDVVGPLHFTPCPANALLLHGIAAFPQSGRVDDMQWHAIQFNALAQHVTGGAGNVRNDGGITSGKGVQKTGLARIWTAQNHQIHAFIEQTALTRGGKHLVDGGEQRAQPIVHLSVGEKIDFLVGEVDGRLHEHPQRDQFFKKPLDTL